MRRKYLGLSKIQVRSIKAIDEGDEVTLNYRFSRILGKNNSPELVIVRTVLDMQKVADNIIALSISFITHI